jgi:hypothetical protein
VTTQGIILIDLAGVGLILLILNLVRTKKLHVGYAAIWFLAVASMMVIITVPPLLYLLPKLVGAIFPASALSLLAFVFIVLMLIFFSVQLSQVSARQVEIIQAIALRDITEREETAIGKDSIPT